MNDFEVRKNIIETKGVYVTTPSGSSMLPFIKGGRDSIAIEKLCGEPSRMDICLFRRQDGGFVIHRLIRKDKDGYVFRGDNCYYCDRGIKDADVIGVMTGFYRGSRYVSAKSRGFRFLSYVWHLAYPLRYVLRLPIRFVRKIFS